MIWIALIALSLLYIVMLGMKLWRDATKTMRTLGEVTEEVSTKWDNYMEASKEAHVTIVSTNVPGSAVFATPEQMKDDYLASKKQRQFDRLLRRVARRKERGQLQSLRDITALKDIG